MPQLSAAIAAAVVVNAIFAFVEEYRRHCKRPEDARARAPMAQATAGARALRASLSRR